MILRDATAQDFDAILALNQAFVSVLSPLDAAQLARLHAQAALHRVIETQGRVQAFLLALREGADYASPNYRWFAAHYPRVLYVDRVVVSAQAQLAGLGTWLYRDAFALARRQGVRWIGCEYDLAPPNPASAGFHARLGFGEVDRAVLGGGKTVSRQLRDLTPAEAAPLPDTAPA